MKEKIKIWLGINSLENRQQTIEHLILHQDSLLNGFAILKKHLQRPDKPLPRFDGEPIKQD